MRNADAAGIACSAAMSSPGAFVSKSCFQLGGLADDAAETPEAARALEGDAGEALQRFVAFVLVLGVEVCFVEVGELARGVEGVVDQAVDGPAVDHVFLHLVEGGEQLGVGHRREIGGRGAFESRQHVRAAIPAPSARVTFGISSATFCL